MPSAFSLEAAGAGIENGSECALGTINASAEVTYVAILNVESVNATGRVAPLTLSKRKFKSAAIGRAFDTEMGLKANN